jgi:hypothetical protein
MARSGYRHKTLDIGGPTQTARQARREEKAIRRARGGILLSPAKRGIGSGRKWRQYGAYTHPKAGPTPKRLKGAHPLHSSKFHAMTGASFVPKPPRPAGHRGVNAPYRIPKGHRSKVI